MLEDKFKHQDGIVVDKYVELTGRYFMKTYDYVLRPRNATTVAYIVFLPYVSEAKGRWYSIVTRGTGNIRVTHRRDSECWDGDYVLSTKCDRVLCYSDGLTWHCISSESATSTTGVTTGVGTTEAPVTERGTTEAPTTAAPTTLAPTTTA